MQPNDQPQHPIDYLDSIAATPKRSATGVSNKLFFGVIIAAVLLLLTVVPFILLNAGSNNSGNLSQLSARLQNLQTVTDAAQKNIVSSKLRATNTSLSLTLTGANRELEEPLKASEIDPAKLDPKIVARENTDELTKKLEDARLNAVHDRTYAREMTYQLDTLIVLVEQIESKTKKTSTKEALTTIRNNLQPLQKQFSDFNATTT